MGMEYKDINKTVLDQLKIMERSLQDFHAFRILWADLIANGVECGISQDKLEQEQVRHLLLALSGAESIRKLLKIEWVEIGE